MMVGIDVLEKDALQTLFIGCIANISFSEPSRDFKQLRAQKFRHVP